MCGTTSGRDAPRRCKWDECGCSYGNWNAPSVWNQGHIIYKDTEISERWIHRPYRFSTKQIAALLCVSARNEALTVCISKQIVANDVSVIKKKDPTQLECFPLAADIRVSMKLFKVLGQLRLRWQLHHQHLGQRHSYLCAAIYWRTNEGIDSLKTKPLDLFLAFAATKPVKNEKHIYIVYLKLLIHVQHMKAVENMPQAQQ